MSSRNLIKEVREAASRHADNPAVKALVEKMDLAQRVANSFNASTTQVDEMIGYALANQEEEGYHLFLNPPRDFMARSMNRAFLFHELAVIVDCLVSVLSTLGERL